jgi:hypothetical protein
MCSGDIVSRPESERRLAAVALIIALGVAACGGDDADPAGTAGTTAVAGSVVFGEGEIPDGFPEDFPIPEAATVGSTLRDPVRNRYEVVLFLPSDRDAAVVFFELNLRNAGYEIVASGAEGPEWRVAFERDDTEGDVLIRLENTGITTAAIDLTTG